MEYLKLKEINEPNIGEVVAINIKDLYAAEIVNLAGKKKGSKSEKYDINRFQCLFAYNSIYDKVKTTLEEEGCKDNIEEYITLLKYEGDGIFNELYTNGRYIIKIAFRPMTFADSDYSQFVNDCIHANKYLANIDYINFMKYYNKYHEIPLSIETWGTLNDKIEDRICKQEQEAHQLGNIITSLAITAAIELYKQKKDILIFDYSYEKGKNRLYDFIHNSNLSTNNQENEEKPKQKLKQDKHVYICDYKSRLGENKD